MSYPPVQQGARSAELTDQRLLLVLVARERHVVAVVAVELVLHDLQNAPGALRADCDEQDVDPADHEVAVGAEDVDRRRDEAGQQGEQHESRDERVLRAEAGVEELLDLERRGPQTDDEREAEEDRDETECDLHHGKFS